MRTEPNRSGPSNQIRPWSFRIAVISGIPIRIHFTFVLFVLWLSASGDEQQGLLWPLFILTVFACILLHELGHALVAQSYGISTRDITLYPIGGIASLEGRPTPRQELRIALAGPAVNMVIALMLGTILWVKGGKLPLPGSLPDRDLFLGLLLAANVTLGLFNLIPAFPMDGGRVLRAFLAIRGDELRATRTAVLVAQAMAVGLLVYAVATQQTLLGLVAVFVFLGSGQELTSTRARSLLAGHTVGEAMLSQFRTIRSGDSVEEAADIMREGTQHDFPVLNGDDVLGVLTRAGIAAGLAMEGTSAYVASVMRRDYATLSPADPLEAINDLLSTRDAAPILVLDGERLVGMLTREKLTEFLLIQNARTFGRRGTG